MTFLYPSFLWALTALFLPLIIHLFNLRKYKKVYFTNVRFLRQVQIETQSKSKLRELLVLLFRTLLLASLVLAFSQPLIRDKESNAVVAGSRHVSIYMDNSFSMENLGRNGPLLDQARQKAKEIVQSFGVQDKFQILTNDFQGKQQRFYDKEEAIRLIDEIKISAVPRKLDQVVNRQTEFLKTIGDKSRHIFVLSDAQKSTFNLSELTLQDSFPVSLVPFSSNQVNNLYIDSCWFETPIQQSGFIQRLKARVVNKGEKSIESGSAKLFMNQAQVSLSSFTLPPGATTDLQFTFECKIPGFNLGAVKIEDYPVTFDDQFYFAFNSKVNIPVYLINGKSQKEGPLNSLFSSDSLFSVVVGTESQVNYSSFKNVEVIVLNQLEEIPSGLLSELEKFTEKGGAIVIVPTDSPNQQNYAGLHQVLGLPALERLDTTNLLVEKIEPSSDFYTGVFEKQEEKTNYPKVMRHFSIRSANRSNFESLLTLINGDVFLGKVQQKQAFVYLFSSSFDESSSNFAKHALFVPTFYRIGFEAIKQAPLYYPVLVNSSLPFTGKLNASGTPPLLMSLDSSMEIIPEVRKNAYGISLFTRDQIKKPGYYVLKYGQKDLLALAFNYERMESDLNCYTLDELKAICSTKPWKGVKILNVEESDFSEQVLEGSEPRRLWKLFIILALVFLIAESFVLRILK